MRSSRGFFSLVLCACLLVAGHRVAGQAVVFSQAAPPPPPPPAAGAPAGAQLKVVPPPPIGIPPEELPRFEVASVKKPDGKTTSSALRTPGGGRITIVNLPLRTIIMQAWGGLRDYQLSGGPSWMTTDRFTVTAKAETNVPREQLMPMVRAVLVDRFQMKYHIEKKEMQAYVLTTAEKEWKPTARMKPVECPTGPAGTPAAPIRPDQIRCGSTMLSTSGIQARGVTMTNFVSLLGSIGGLGVIHDRTGLTGTYQIELDASPTALLRSSSLALALSGLSNPAGAENLLPQVGDGRSLDAAVRDLGLKLARQKEMVDVLVIDSLSQPDED
ncbi:MAG TPA: TIGR03435 family protein [Vicinamibacterales bacterium]|nr:TIGR03435 family protein [Vicinamibacterales bacterium]